MTYFEAVPDTNYFRMHTELSRDTVNIAYGMRDFDGCSLTAAVRRFVVYRKLLEDTQAHGGLLFSRLDDKLAPLCLRAETMDYDEVTQPLTVNVAADVMQVILPNADKDRPDDLVLWWKQSAAFYADVREKDLLGADFFIVKPDLKLSEVIPSNDLPVVEGSDTGTNRR